MPEVSEDEDVGLTHEGERLVSCNDGRYWGPPEAPYMFSLGQRIIALTRLAILYTQAVTGDEVTTEMKDLLQVPHLMRVAPERLIKRGPFWDDSVA